MSAKFLKDILTVWNNQNTNIVYIEWYKLNWNAWTCCVSVKTN